MLGFELEEGLERGVEPQNKSSRREEILEVSLDLFLKKGYASTPIHEIAAVVGTSHSNIHYHFKHKEQILRTLFQPAFERVEELLERDTGRDELLGDYLETMLEDRKLAVLLASDASVSSLPDIEQRVQGLIEGLRQKVAGDRATLEEQMRAECALGVLRSGVVSFPGAEPDAVRGVTLAAAKAALRSG